LKRNLPLLFVSTVTFDNIFGIKLPIVYIADVRPGQERDPAENMLMTLCSAITLVGDSHLSGMKLNGLGYISGFFDEIFLHQSLS